MKPARAPGPIVVMGVSASGKSSVAEALATALEIPWVDADTLHLESSLTRMAAGTALTDADRCPWLDRVGATLAGDHGAGAGVVVACSALKRSYRDRLRELAPDSFFIHLDGDREVLASRAATRQNHFMPASLIDSQIAALQPLETDEPGAVVAIDTPLNVVVVQAIEAVESRG